MIFICFFVVVESIQLDVAWCVPWPQTRDMVYPVLTSRSGKAHLTWGEIWDKHWIFLPQTKADCLYVFNVFVIIAVCMPSVICSFIHYSHCRFVLFVCSVEFFSGTHLVCLWFSSLPVVTFCVGLQEEEPQTTHPMSVIWASHIAASMLTGH